MRVFEQVQFLFSWALTIVKAIAGKMEQTYKVCLDNASAHNIIVQDCQAKGVQMLTSEIPIGEIIGPGGHRKWSYKFEQNSPPAGKYLYTGFELQGQDSYFYAGAIEFWSVTHGAGIFKGLQERDLAVKRPYNTVKYGENQQFRTTADCISEKLIERQNIRLKMNLADGDWNNIHVNLHISNIYEILNFCPDVFSFSSYLGNEGSNLNPSLENK